MNTLSKANGNNLFNYPVLSVGSPLTNTTKLGKTKKHVLFGPHARNRLIWDVKRKGKEKTCNYLINIALVVQTRKKKYRQRTKSFGDKKQRWTY